MYIYIFHTELMIISLQMWTCFRLLTADYLAQINRSHRLYRSKQKKEWKLSTNWVVCCVCMLFCLQNVIFIYFIFLISERIVIHKMRNVDANKSMHGIIRKWKLSELLLSSIIKLVEKLYSINVYIVYEK